MKQYNIMDTQYINIKEIDQNKGQIAGLPANPRQWTRDDVERLAKSIEETPELLEARPLIAVPHDGKYIVLGGNLRLAALKHLGRKDVPVYVLPEDTPIDKQKEIAVKDNGAFGAWDFDMLANEWDDLPLLDWGVPSWDAQPEKETTDAQEDDFDENEQEIQARCKLGDIWQLGDHRLMCGDATSREDVQKLRDGKGASLALPDPPYGINVVGKNGTMGGGDLCEKGIYAPIIGDNTTDTARENFNIIKELSTRLIIFGGNYFFDFLPPSSSWIIWDKKGNFESNNYADGEMAWCRFKTPIRIYKQIWRGLIKEGEHEKRLHPTQKPVNMLSSILADFSNDGETILDCFGGSGSTLIACEQLNRRCFMMELDPHYCDVIIARWEKLTGREGVKIN